MKKIHMVWAGIAVVLAIIFTLQAQNTAIPMRPVFIHAPVPSTEDDLATMIQAVEQTTPLAADSVPMFGTFYSAQHNQSSPEPWPPFPGNIHSSPAWNLGDNVWLLDDLTVDYAAPRTASLSSGGGMHAMDAPGVPGGGGGSGGGFSPMFSMSTDYGTNLWIAQAAISSNNLVGIATNTLADIQYEIQSRTNLLQTNWESEGFILGSELTNWTPLSVAENGRTNLFLRLRSWADSTGSGIPDWWWLQNFGQTTNVDSYADPDGDGWNNLEEFENGTDPNFYDPPPTPPDTNAPPPTFTLVSGPQGHFYVIGSGLPADLSAIRIFRHGHPGTTEWPYGSGTGFPVDLPDGSFDIPVASITNGIGQIPASEAYAFGNYIFQAEAMRSNNINGTTNYLGIFFNSVFVDGRAQLKDNLRFLLRAAGGDGPFEVNGIVQPTDYVYSGFYDSYYADFDPLTPFENNYLYRNFEFDINNLVSTNYFTSLSDPNYYFVLVGIPKGIQFSYDFDPNYYRDINTVDLTYALDIAPLITTNDPVAPSSWNVSQARWLFPPSSDDYIGGFISNSNWFGLSYLSELSPYYTNNEFLTATFYPDAPPTSPPGGFYFETAQPGFQTVDYYFARAGIDPIPEQGAYVGYSSPTFFATTNTTPLLIAGVGQSLPQLAGYAKLSVTNGYTGLYAYLAQYFDTAYKIDTNGVTTTNTTGVLSPYGNFYATEPGPAALVTMPDIDTGARGTCTVYCASMQVDKNHDGNMDLSFNGADATSQANPMVAWVNNGYIEPANSSQPDHDVEMLKNVSPNYSYGQITCQRDLENFFRLWICGVPSLPLYENYTFTLSMTPASGNPVINVYGSYETNGGTGYLTDTNIAAQQAAISTSYGISMGTVSNGSPCTIPSIAFAFGGTQHFLFEGAGIGEGQLTLTISQNGNVVAQTSVWIDLHDIKDLYEQAHISGVPRSFPAMVNTTNTSTFVSDHELPPNPAETNQLVVFVHGWRMGVWDYQDFSDTMFKRLYWANYQGRFASLRWPTLSADDYRVLSDFQSYTTYNRSEHIAFDSGAGTSAYLDWLQGRFPDYTIGVAAHSMGNIVMMEALKDQLAESQSVIDNYVMMQAAVPAHCYQTNLPNYSVFTTAETSSPTPDIYRGYPGNIAAAVNNQIVNFLNTNDFALATGTTNILGVTVAANWEANQVNDKPDDFWDYTTDGTNCSQDNPTFRVVTNPIEKMAFVARPRTKAAGALPGIGGVVKTSGQVDLTANFGFARPSEDHSAEFNWNIQQLNGTNGFYQVLLQDLSQ